MDVGSLIDDLKTHARVDGIHEDHTIALMLEAAAKDVCHAAGIPVPETVGDLPSDLRFAIIDQAARTYDARGADDPAPGLSAAAGRIAHRYRGVRIDAANINGDPEGAA